MTVKPWMTDTELGVIEELLNKVQPQNSLEWGAGYSTIYFPRFLTSTAKWIAVEHNKQWADKISNILGLKPVFFLIKDHSMHQFFLRSKFLAVIPEALKWLVFSSKWRSNPEIKIVYISPNKSFLHAPLEEGTYSDFEDYINFPDKYKYFDFILIDGRARKDCLIKAYEILKENGIVVLHDANRKYYHQPFSMYKYQLLIRDDHTEEGGIWIGSKGRSIEPLLKK